MANISHMNYNSFSVSAPEQMIIMEAFFHLGGNQIRRCVKMEQRELLSGLSTTLNLEITISHSTRKYQISFENDMAFLRLENVCSTARETQKT